MSLKHHLLVLLAMCPTSWCWDTTFTVRMGIKIRKDESKEKCSEEKVKQILQDTLEEMVKTKEYIGSYIKNLRNAKKEVTKFDEGDRVKSLVLLNGDDPTQNVQVGDRGEVMEVRSDGKIQVLFADTKKHVVEAGQIEVRNWRKYEHRFKFKIDTVKAEDGSKFAKKLEEWIEIHHNQYNAFEHPILQNRSDEHTYTLFIELEKYKTQERLAKRLRLRRGALKEENAEVSLLNAFTLTFAPRSAESEWSPRNDKLSGLTYSCIDKTAEVEDRIGAKVKRIITYCDPRLHPGSRILKIDGEDVRNWNFLEISEHIQMRRFGAKPYTITFEETQGPPTAEADPSTESQDITQEQTREAKELVRERGSKAKRLRVIMEAPKKCNPERGSLAEHRRSKNNKPYSETRSKGFQGF